MAGMTKEEVEQAVERLENKKTRRQLFETTWEEIRNYMLPNRPSFNTKEPLGSKTMQHIFDGTAIDAINVCKAGINGMLTNAALPWHGIELEDEKLNQVTEAQEALQEVNEVMAREYHRSNFYTNIDGVYEEVIGFGESCLFIGEGKYTALNFLPIPLKELFTDENEEGTVDTVFRSFSMTARQCAQKWGTEKLTNQMKEALKQTGGNLDKEFEILHYVHPRSDREIDLSTAQYKQDAQNKLYLSAYIDVDSKTILDEGGYDEFPFSVPRLFLMSGDDYGRGMGWNALPDVKMLNTMEKYGIRGWQKAVDPPITAPDEGFSMPIKTFPGGVTYNSRWREQGSEVKPLYGPNHSVMLPNYENKCEQKREQIREFFFYKQFRTQQQGQPRTAQEIIQIASENLKILGPLLNRFQEELLKPIILRSFQILFRAQMFPKLYAFLRSSGRQVKFKIVYLSPIAKAQRLYEAQELQNAFGMLLPAYQIMPELLDPVDPDKLYSEVVKLYPAMRNVTRKENDVKKLRSDRAAKAAAANAQMTLANAAATAKTASEADPNAGILGQLTGTYGAPVNG